MLITGEVGRTTDFETSMPLHEAHGDGGWEPDPLILDGGFHLTGPAFEPLVEPTAQALADLAPEVGRSARPRSTSRALFWAGDMPARAHR